MTIIIIIIIIIRLAVNIQCRKMQNHVRWPYLQHDILHGKRSNEERIGTSYRGETPRSIRPCVRPDSA